MPAYHIPNSCWIFSFDNRRYDTRLKIRIENLDEQSAKVYFYDVMKQTFYYIDTDKPVPPWLLAPGFVIDYIRRNIGHAMTMNAADILPRKPYMPPTVQETVRHYYKQESLFNDVKIYSVYDRMSENKDKKILQCADEELTIRIVDFLNGREAPFKGATITIVIDDRGNIVNSKVVSP